MNYGKGIRLVRTIRGLSQRQLAELVGLDPSYLSLVETGRRTPSSKALERIASALQVPFHLLVLLSSDSEDLRGVDKRQAEDLGKALLSVLHAAEDDAEPVES